jgi:hypothetical protein
MGEWLSSAGGQGSLVGCLLVNAPSSRVDHRPTASHPAAPPLPRSDTRSAAVARFTFVIVVVPSHSLPLSKNIALLAPYIIPTTVPRLCRPNPVPDASLLPAPDAPAASPNARPPPRADLVVLRLSSQVA